MILVDTSAWVEFLRATGSPTDRRLTELLHTDQYAITDPIAAELLAGTRTDQDLARVRGIVDTGVFVAVRPLFDWEAAADLYRECRRHGTTPRSLIDCLIAAVAIGHDLAVLAVDRDLEAIARHSPLQIVA